MYTRGPVTHAYDALPLQRSTLPGAVRMVQIKNIPTTWAITRPVTGWIYPLSPSMSIYNTIGGSASLVPPRPRLEMDPTNRDTWQRPYVFS